MFFGTRCRSSKLTTEFDYYPRQLNWIMRSFYLFVCGQDNSELWTDFDEIFRVSSYLPRKKMNIDFGPQLAWQWVPKRAKFSINNSAMGDTATEQCLQTHPATHNVYASTVVAVKFSTMTYHDQSNLGESTPLPSPAQGGRPAQESNF